MGINQSFEVASVELATVPAFQLGPLDVNPPTREVQHGGKATIAEPRALQVLIALYQAAGAVVSRDDLLRRCWDGRVVGDDAINRSIAKARELAALSAPPAFVIETIPRVGYRLTASAPLPTADSFPPQGKTADGPAPTEVATQTPFLARRRLLLGTGALAAGMACAGGFWALRRPHGPARPPLVAVLPFDNLSPDPQLSYFADSLSEDILNNLTRAGGLRVAARSSSFTFRGPAKVKAGTALGADYLLDGSVLRDGGRLRVNAYLSDPAGGQTLWSQTYDRDAGEELRLEDDIAQRVASALKVQLSLHAAPLIDPAVYDLYLRGRDLTRQHDPASNAEGAQLLQQAVTRAPDFADAWFQLAWNRWCAGFILPNQDAAYAVGRDAAHHVLAIDPNYGAAYGVLTQLTPPYHHWGEMEAGLARGLQLSPGDTNLLMWRGDLRYRTGRLKAAADDLRRAFSSDPLSFANNLTLFLILVAARQYGEAEPIMRRIEDVWPKQLSAYWNRFWFLAASGHELDAAAYLDDASRRIPDQLPQEFPVLSEAMRAAVSGSVQRRKLASRQCQDLARYGLGYAMNSILLLGKLGEDDAAADLARAVFLDQGSIPVDRSVMWVGNTRFNPFGELSPDVLFQPMVSRVRRDGKFNAIFDAIGLTAFWQSSGPPDPA